MNQRNERPKDIRADYVRQHIRDELMMIRRDIDRTVADLQRDLHASRVAR